MSEVTTKSAVNERVIALVIHAFTVAHMIAAGISGPAAGPILTPMTISMLCVIGGMCGINGSVMKFAAKFASNFVGFLLGVSIAEFIIGLIPGAGNLANAIATGIVTELLGWSCFIVITGGFTGNFGFWDKLSLLKKSWGKWRENEDFRSKIKKAEEAMPEDLRARYNSLMKTISNDRIPQSQRDNAIHEAEEILKPYGISFDTV